MEATWLGFDLWSDAVAAAGSSRSGARCAPRSADCAIRAPSGFTVRVDAETQHLLKPAFVGRIDRGRILPVWTSAGAHRAGALEPMAGAARKHSRRAPSRRLLSADAG